MACFRFGEIVLPKNMDLQNWAVVACDQYTSNRGYWERLYASLLEPSTLHLIFPEVFLGDGNRRERIADIIEKQRAYIAADLFESVEGTVVLERKSGFSHTHKGLMLLADLSEYSFGRGEKTLIRATEAVVPERVPPRVEIRKDCALELPHIMLLYDDPGDTVLGAAMRDGKKLYGGELNAGGGSITGYQIKDTSKIEAALNHLAALSENRYGEPLLFLVGDGNHSLATAKACYDETMPLSRYALVEAVNIYDPGIVFEPIHRVITGIDTDAFVKAYRDEMKGHKGETTLVTAAGKTRVPLPDNAIEAVKAVDAFIEGYKSEHGGSIDYIHGGQELTELSAKPGNAGIYLKKIEKATLFPYVVEHGPLPKKTFSMGEAEEKRYYIEARFIR